MNLECVGNNIWGQTDNPNDIGLVDLLESGSKHSCTKLKSERSIKCWGYSKDKILDIPSEIDGREYEEDRDNINSE